MSDHGDVGIFHHKFGLDNTTSEGVGPREITAEVINFRMQFLCEELQEFLEGVGLSFKTSLWDLVQQNTNPDREPSHEKIFDALIDLNYVSHGTAHLLGYPWSDGWIAVHRANMAKERAQTAEQSTRGSTFDVIKPPGWTPPDIRGILRTNGWETYL